MSMRFRSPAFAAGEGIPVEFTGDGEDRSPPLLWDDVPAATRSLAIVCEDVDAPGGRFIHWLVYDLPPALRELPEGFSSANEMGPLGSCGLNDFGTDGWRGPKPPAGPQHEYQFTLYALDQPTGLPPGADIDQLLATVDGHVLQSEMFAGTYQADLAHA